MSNDEKRIKRIAIVGSREFPYKWMVHDYISAAVGMGWEIVSGGARGVDSWAADTADYYHLRLKVFHADWDTHGKRAGFLRNQDIVNYADEVVAFWDGNSKGTEHTVRLARDAGKLREVIIVQR